MNSRERVLKTFAMEMADRMPIDYFGNAGINQKLFQHFHTDYEGLLDALDVDFCQIRRVLGLFLFSSFRR